MRPLLVGILACAASCFADDAPQMATVSAKNAKPGDVVTVEGVGLGKNQVDEVYLTDHKFDMKVKVLEQESKSITIRIPPFAKPGRMELMVLTKGEEPKLLEQPCYILIEDATTEVSQVKKPEAAKPPVEQQQQQRDKN
jgi:hypothetical protein